ncbi:MAG: hypothetical protein IJ104_04115 [Methanobrevibacter sp.]|nr:hypothetical protein [Methanobrevibacter sp.]
MVKISYYSLNDDMKGYMVNATTMNDWDDTRLTGLSLKLLVETLKELGMEDNAKEFSKKAIW